MYTVKMATDLKELTTTLLGSVRATDEDSYMRGLREAIKEHPEIKTAILYGSKKWGKAKPGNINLLLVAKGAEEGVQYNPVNVTDPLTGKRIAMVSPVVVTEGHLKAEESPLRGLGHLSNFAFSPREVIKGQEHMDAHVQNIYRQAMPHLVYYGILPRELEVKKGEEHLALNKVVRNYFGVDGRGYWRSKPGLEGDPVHLRKSVFYGWQKKPDAVEEVGKANAPMFFKAMGDAGFQKVETEGGFKLVAPKEMRTAKLPRVRALISQAKWMPRRSIKVAAKEVGSRVAPKGLHR